MKGSFIQTFKRTGALALAFSLLFVAAAAPLPAHAEDVPDTDPLFITQDDLETPDVPEPSVAFDGLGDFYISPVDLLAGEEQVALADYFLYGVTALDENGNALPVELSDDSGFSISAEPGSQYVLTYTARHPALGEVTGTRTAVLAESGPEAFASDGYMITYDGNGNSGGDPPVDPNPHAEGEPVPVLDNTGGLYRNGYLFTGWNTRPDGSGETCTPGSEIVASVDMLLYALWVEAAPPSDPDWERLRQAVNDYSAPAITIYPRSSNETEDLANGVLVLRDNEDCIDSNGNPIPVARDVTLLAADRAITLYTRNATDGRHFDLAANGPQNLTLAFQNVVVDGNGQAGGLSIGERLTATLENAVVQNCKAVRDGGGLYVAGNLTMNGGRIAGNTASGTGGGVYVSGGVFHMNGSAISGNTAGTSGGGVLLNNGTSFTMNGGEISENALKYPGTGYGPGEYGGGVTVREGGTFILEDGRISKNEAESGNGVYVYKGAFIMNGGEITENTTGGSGGGLWLNAGTFTMNGGAISNNTADLYGGGVFVDSNFAAVSGFEMTGGAISGNKARSGGGVYVTGGTGFTPNPSTFAMAGGTVSDNAAASGGGIYTADSSYSNISTDDSAAFFGNTADAPHDYGLARGKADYPSMNWSGENSIFGTHLLNNYDINYDLGEPPMEYLVLFLDWDGTVLSKEYIPQGFRADVPPDPVRNGYTFSGWDGDLGMLEDVASDLTFTATYQEDVITAPSETEPVTEAKAYTIRYLRGQHGAFAETTHSGIDAGAATPSSPRAAGDSGWVFDGWLPERSATVTDNVDYVAQWERVGRSNERDDGTFPREATDPTVATERGATAEEPERGESGASIGTAPPPARPILPGTEAAPEPGAMPGETLAPTTEPESGPSGLPEVLPNNEGGPVPLAAFEPPWAFLNLILSILGVLLAVFAAVQIRRKTRRNDVSPEERWRRRGSGRLLIAASVPAALGVILFLFTEDMRRPLAFADRWTVLHAILLAAEAAAMFLARKARGEEARRKS